MYIVLPDFFYTMEEAMQNKSIFSFRANPWARIFFPVWAGQLVSLIGTGLSEFALSLWVYQHTQSITQYAFVLMFRTLPIIFLSPFVGVIVDRFDRRKIMIISDTGSAFCSLVIAILFLSAQLQPWQVYIVASISAGFGALQAPAYLSVISSLVSKESLGRVNGLLQLGQAISDLLVPVLAASLMAVLGLSGILVIDFASFLVAVTTLMFIRFPSYKDSEDNQYSGPIESYFQGINYLRSRMELKNLLYFNAGFFFFAGMLEALLIPLFMGITTVPGMGLALTIAGCGLLIGSTLISLGIEWATYQKGMLFSSMIFGVSLIFAGINTNVLWVAVFIFIAHFCWPYIQGASQAIWQAAVVHEMQGRVFATRQMILRIIQPVSLLFAGYVADHYLEPFMQNDGNPIGLIEGVFGGGSGRGAAILVSFIGVAILGLGVYFKTAKPVERLD